MEGRLSVKRVQDEEALDVTDTYEGNMSGNSIILYWSCSGGSGEMLSRWEYL